jgi:hypothetical protein
MYQSKHLTVRWTDQTEGEAQCVTDTLICDLANLRVHT